MEVFENLELGSTDKKSKDDSALQGTRTRLDLQVEIGPAEDRNIARQLTSAFDGAVQNAPGP